MGKSPLHEKIDQEGSAFDPQMNFSQFLEEAKQHAREVNLQTTTSHAEELVKKSKKSWKTSLFFWLKSEKKSKTNKEPEKISHHTLKPIRRHVSGPVFRSERAVHLQRQTSGPLTNLFNKTTGTENQIPYMSLHHLHNHHPVKVYGPVYLVT